jgi:hypothetical protein
MMENLSENFIKTTPFLLSQLLPLNPLAIHFNKNCSTTLFADKKTVSAVDGAPR